MHSGRPFVLSSLTPFLKARGKALLLVAGVSILAGLAGLVGPLTLRRFTDAIQIWNGAGPIPAALLGFLFVLFAGKVVTSLLESLEAVLQVKVGFDIISDLQLSIFRRLHRTPMSFFSSARQGDILYRLTNDIEAIRELNSDALPRLTQETVTAAIALLAMWSLHPPSALIVVVASVVFMSPGLLLNKRIRTMVKRDNSFLEKIYAHLQESVETPRLIRTFGLQESEVASQERELKSWQKVSMSTALVRKVGRQMPRFGIILMPGLVFITAGPAVWNQSITLGSLIALVGLIPGVFAPFRNIADNTGVYQQAMPSLERVCEFLHLPQEQPDNLPHYPPLQGEIELRNVRFTYPGAQEQVLSGLNLHIRPGEHLGLVGASGSGKSTIVQLLMGLYRTDSGTLLVDSVEPRSRDLTSLRQQIGFVAQDTFLLNSSLQDNVLYAAPDSSEAEVHAALRVSGLKGWVDSLPAGLNTIVGERGLKLSGGQRQRLAVARAVLRDPRMLILDEATSSLDGETEAQLQEELEQLMPGRTVITIAHRLATVRHCDRIVVLSGGSIIEEGSFEDLLMRRGVFSTLYEAQFQNKAGLGA